MAFCGCSLRASSICAVVFAIIESIIGFSVTIIWMMVGAYRFRYWEKEEERWRGMSGSGSGSNTMRQFFVPEFFGVMVTFSFSNGFWLIASIVLIVGIVKKNARLHKFWVIVSTLVLISDVISDIYLIVGFVRAGYSWPENTQSRYYEFSISFFALFSIGTKVFVFFIVNIFLIFYTYERAIEIERGQSSNAFMYGGQPQHTLLAPGQSAGAVPLVVYPVREEVRNPTYRSEIPVGQPQHNLLALEQSTATAPLMSYSGSQEVLNISYNTGIPVMGKVGTYPDQRY